MRRAHKEAERAGDVLAYTDCGPLASTAVALCHGAGYDGRTFDAVADALAGEGWRVLCPDNRGAGASTDTAGLIATGGPRALAEDLLAILDHAGVTRAHVVGHSLGGWVALAAALADERVVSVTLVDSPAGIFTAEVDLFWNGFVDRLRDGAPPAAFAALDLLRAQAPSATDLTRLAARLPVAFLTGADDAVYPETVVRAAASAVPGATVTVLAGAGHLSYLDAPSAVNQALTAVLSAAGDAPSGAA